MVKKSQDVADTIVIPSNPVDRKALKDELYEMGGHYRIQDDQKEKIKDIVDSLFDKYKIPKKVINKMAKTLYKSNYEEVTEENQQFEILMDTINTVSASPTAGHAILDEED